MQRRYFMRYLMLALFLAGLSLAGWPSAAFSQASRRVYLPISFGPSAAPKLNGPGVCLTAQEAELGQRINDYRVSVGLPAAPLSKSLSMVGQYHVRDLQTNRPDTGTDNRGLGCTMHSWSNKGYWSPVCYTPDHHYASGMWVKPKEITRGVYTDYGYEIAAALWGRDITAADALDLWKNSPPHNDVITEHGVWSGMHWPAMGIGISTNYAVVWFSTETDPQGGIGACQ